jgi:hypothetical protein
MPEDPKNLFLQYYGDYLDAKEKNHPLVTWLKAVQCRAQLQKIGDRGDSPGKEAQICQDIFEAFVSKKKPRRYISSFTMTILSRVSSDGVVKYDGIP